MTEPAPADTQLYRQIKRARQRYEAVHDWIEPDDYN
jgi:hypothetical protein